jgi:hypothetical protein
VTDATSTTILRLRPEWKAGDTQTGFWGTEYVNVGVRGLEMPGVQDIRIQLSAWGEAATITGVTGDIDLLYVQGTTFNQHLTLTLGRQLISGGAARVLQLDGLNAAVAIGRASSRRLRPHQSRFVYRWGTSPFGGRAYEAVLREARWACPSWRSSAMGWGQAGPGWMAVAAQSHPGSHRLRILSLKKCASPTSTSRCLAASQARAAKASVQEPDPFLPFTSVFTVHRCPADTLGRGVPASDAVCSTAVPAPLGRGRERGQVELRAIYKFTVRNPPSA